MSLPSTWRGSWWSPRRWSSPRPSGRRWSWSWLTSCVLFSFHKPEAAPDPHDISAESLAPWEHERHVCEVLSRHHSNVVSLSPLSPVWHVTRVTRDWVFCLRPPPPSPARHVTPPPLRPDVLTSSEPGGQSGSSLVSPMSFCLLIGPEWPV